MNTVLLPQPLINPSASTTKTVTINISVNGDTARFNSLK
jgi:hypothetical protein